jgi:multimeric flavodoxin WrbA
MAKAKKVASKSGSKRARAAGAAQGGPSAKKVVILMGSPRRRGNTAALAERIARGASDAGAHVDAYYLHGMKIAPCCACEACHRPESTGCVIQDDMQRLYPELRAADAIVLASPIYWFSVSAQMKTVVDRCYALMSADGGHEFRGKRIGLAFAYGADDPLDSGCVNAIRSFQDAFRFIGADIVGMVYGSAAKEGDIRADSRVMDAAADLGRKLAE